MGASPQTPVSSLRSIIPRIFSHFSFLVNIKESPFFSHLSSQHKETLLSSPPLIPNTQHPTLKHHTIPHQVSSYSHFHFNSYQPSTNHSQFSTTIPTDKQINKTPNNHHIHIHNLSISQSHNPTTSIYIHSPPKKSHSNHTILII